MKGNKAFSKEIKYKNKKGGKIAKRKKSLHGRM